MANCPFCEKEIAIWETLCNDCWKLAIESARARKNGAVDLVIRLKAKAKEDLFLLVKNYARHVPRKMTMPVTFVVTKKRRKS